MKTGTVRPFQLLVKPAAGDCNLRCEYCFYRRTTPALYPETKRPRMSRETMEALVRELLSYRFPETVFCWQGGEPTLMGLEFFEAVVAAQMRHGRSGQVVGNAFQTNGVLIDDDWARFLAKYQFVVGLSLDGPRGVHDHYRKNAAGAGSFEAALGAAERLQSRGAAVNVLCVVNRLNQERAGEVYRFFRGQGFDYLQFIPILETDPATGEVADFSATPEGLARFFAEFFAEYKRDGFPRVSERNLDALLAQLMTGAPGVCTFAERCGDYLVIEHNGDVFPCDFFVDPAWRLGRLGERPLAEFFGHPLMRRFAEAKSRYADACRGCARLARCHGGCQKDRLPDRGAAPGRTHFCSAYQALFELTDPDLKRWIEDERRRRGESEGPAASALTRPPGASDRPGRNDPCPCGSGKKFKKCCGAK